MFEARDITFSYGPRALLRGVSFVVSPGEIACVAGANGAGKTTLLKILATLAVPESGKIRIDGRDVSESPFEYRRKIGYMPETPVFYEDMTVKDYLSFRASLKGENPKRIRKRVDDAIEACRLGKVADSGLGGLSLGVRRRAALADAILLKPKVLLLDDFLAGLDVETREAAAETLSEIAAFSCVVATGHELADFARWTTRFLVLRNGVISADIQAAGTDPATAAAQVAAALKGGVA